MAPDGDEDIRAALRDLVIDNIRIGKQIGSGANGRILEAKWEGIVVAVKEIHSIFMNEVTDEELFSRLKEVSYVNVNKVVNYAILI